MNPLKHPSCPARIRLLVTLLATSLLGACAAMEADEATETQQILAAAGFKLKLENTPEQFAHIQSLTQRKLVPHEKDGQIYYVYADAQYCKCLYWGNEEAYQRYQKLALQQEIAEEQRSAAMMNQNAAMNWGMWGMGPWWVY